jgi:predicted Zn-dependent protease
VVKSNLINAFTAGGRIYVYEGIIDFVKSDDELISVIGHEVYHNELGHIANAIKKQKATEAVLGEGSGWIASAASAILTPSFNQEQEAMSDFHGVDVTIANGYDGCQTINLWGRMAEDEDENELAKLARSHPFSNDRKECVRSHIQRNYNYICK